MTEAYAIANDQLRKERDDANARLKDVLSAAQLAAQGNVNGARELAEARTCIGKLQDERREWRARAEAAEKERDDLRAQIQTGDYLLRPAPPTISEVMLQGALQRAETAEKERDAAIERPQSSLWRSLCDDACAELATAKARIADLEAAAPRTPTDLEERTGPVAFERNQLREEVAELRAQLKAQSDSLNKHWQEQVRLAKAEGRRRARSLAAMLHAHVNAVAGEEP